MKSSCRRRKTATKTVPKTATKTTEPGSASQIAGQPPRALEKIKKVHRETLPDARHRRMQPQRGKENRQDRPQTDRRRPRRRTADGPQTDQKDKTRKENRVGQTGRPKRRRRGNKPSFLGLPARGMLQKGVSDAFSLSKTVYPYQMRRKSSSAASVYSSALRDLGSR